MYGTNDLMGPYVILFVLAIIGILAVIIAIPIVAIWVYHHFHLVKDIFLLIKKG